MSQDAPKERALALQAELQRLKAAGLAQRVRRAPPGTPGAPWPIEVLQTFDPPASCRVDVGALRLALKLLDAGFLQQQPPPASAIAVEVTAEPRLPPELAAAIAARVHAAWAAAAAARADQAGFGIEATLQSVARDFSSLVALRPECLEAYEGVDAAGATVRRFALVSPAADEEEPSPSAAADAATPIESAAAAAASTGAAEAAAAAARAPQRGPNPLRPPVLRPAVKRPAAQGLAAEVAWLSSRFGAALKLTPPQQQQQQPQQQQQQPPPSGFSLLLTPTDPLWGSRGAVHVTGSFPQSGGSAGGSSSGGATGIALRVLATPGVPAPTAARLEAGLMRRVADDSAAAGAPVLRGAIKWLEGYAAVAADAPREDGAGNSGGAVQGAASGRGRAPADNDSGRDSGSGSDDSGSWSDGSGSGSGSSGYETHDSDDSEDDDGSGGDDHAAAPAGAGAAGEGAPPPQGDQHSGGGAAFGIAIEGLQLDGIDALEPLELRVQLACARCGAAAAAAAFAPPASGARRWEWKAQCAGCKAAMWAVVRPRIAHEGSNELAALIAEGCAPVDLLPSLFGAQCGRCSALVALRSVQIGLPATRNCTHCHERLTLVAPAVAFKPKRAPGGSGTARRAAGDGAARPRRRRADALTAPPPGSGPLPLLGACKHYRHSHRWLRFPCCGLRFPCDLCHEEQTDGHEMQWAKRMVCGYCSTEQAVAERCAACGKRLASSGANPSGRNTRFWEGGQGCRDPSKMSKKDARRYRGSKLKTRSAKAKRVGPKAYS